MFRNVYYDQQTSTIHLWETINGKRVYSSTYWTPFVFTKAGKKETGIKSIFGDNVLRRQFPDFQGYKDFINNQGSHSQGYVSKINETLDGYWTEANRIKAITEKRLLNDEEKNKLSELIQKIKFIKIKLEDQNLRYVPDDPIEKRKEVRSSTEKRFDYFENDVKPEIQFLVDRYYDVDEDTFETPKLHIHTFDIEVVSTKGFPLPSKADWPITLIGCHDTGLNELHVFGCKEYTGENLKEPWFHYHYHKNEKDLIKAYYKFVNKTQPDIITGWNIQRFDIEYLIRRTEKIFSKREAKDIISLLSPIGIVSHWENNTGLFNLDIAGISIIDYIRLYKEYTKTLLGINLESYSLDFVSNFELEKRKLDYSEYANLTELFNKNFNKYTDYNVIDVKRVKQINEKRNFLNVLLMLSLFSKCPMKYCEAVTSIIEGAFLSYYRRNNLCAPKFMEGQQKRSFKAAYVKEPQLGLHWYIADLDITSSYPHAMICLNMGTESYFGTIYESSTNVVAQKEELENLIIDQTRKREYKAFKYYDENHQSREMREADLLLFNKELKDGKYAIAPNGSIFRTDIKGTIAEVVRETFELRKSAKNKQENLGKDLDKLREEFNKTSDKDSTSLDNLSAKFDRLKSLQIAYKKIINSIYGSISTPYSRDFNTYIAEAITAVGRHSVKCGNIYVNEVMNDINKSTELKNIINEFKSKSNKLENISDKPQEYDYIIYIDTDSEFINIGKFIELNGLLSIWKSLTEDERVDYSKRIATAAMIYVNSNSYERTQIQDFNSQEHNYKISFKFETISKSGLWIAKKKYVLNLIDVEGVRPEEPIKATGLEIIRSDTPIAAKERLKEIMRDLLDGASIEKISRKVEDFKEEMKEVAPEEIANNIGCRDISEYMNLPVSDSEIMNLGQVDLTEKRKEDIFRTKKVNNQSVEYIEYSNFLPEEKLSYKKGTPRHIKAVFNYNRFRLEENLLDKYEDINAGEKAKIVYLKPNRYNIESMAFLRWITEFKNYGIEIDYNKMIQKNLVDKVTMLLEPMKLELIDIDREEVFNLFF